MKTILFLFFASVVTMLPLFADPASDLKSLLDKGITSGPEFEKAVAAVRSGKNEQLPDPFSNPEPPMAYEKLQIGNETYEKVTVRRVDPDGLSIMHSAGAKKLLFMNMDPEMQAAYGYDPAKAANYRAQVAAHAALSEAEDASKIANARLKKADYDLMQAIKEESVQAWVKVQQNAGGGLCLCKWGEYEKKSVMSYTGTSPKVIGSQLVDSGEKDGMIAVTGLGQKADGERWKGTLFPCGVYTYESVGAGPRTVKRYATTAQGAFDIMTR